MESNSNTTNSTDPETNDETSILRVKVPDVCRFTSPHSILLCGPGPMNIHPRVAASLGLPQMGHMDRNFLSVYDDIISLLRYTFQTDNKLSIPISGTGSAAWEAAVANITDDTDKYLVFVNGYFGERHCEMARRHGASVVRVDKPWGEAFSFEEIEAAMLQHKPTVVWLCHTETSTGVLQPVEGVGQLARKLDCLFMLDTVTSLGGCKVLIDEWLVDVSYSGGQKCLGCTAGISLLTLGPRAHQQLLQKRARGPPKTWYLDVCLLEKYLFDTGSSRMRVYHHTAPIPLVYALREALSVIAEEGLEARWNRHEETANFFLSQIEDLGFEPFVNDSRFRSSCMITVKAPPAVDIASVVQHCRRLNIEVGEGLGKLRGQIIRVGLMGYNSRPEVAVQVAAALRLALNQQKTLATST